jgi:light-regulated signal transduction histidine kinase (bacteriophytochrome)
MVIAPRAGAPRAVVAAGQPIVDAGGGKLGAVVSLQDVTERVRAEQTAAERLKELLRSNKELEQFVYVASHDLQEPLRMVGSFTQLLARRYKGKLGSDADEFIAFAVDGVVRMQNLINDLLTYARVGSPVEMALVDSGAVFDTAVANLEGAVRDARAVITRTALPILRADAAQLAQLFQNLLSNALKFRREEPPKITVSAEREGLCWHFSVRDEGIGIDKAYFDRIFVVFQRLHTRDKYEGTGIGLAICKKIVERHKGSIWVESEVGEGSTFHFTLPAGEKP